MQYLYFFVLIMSTFYYHFEKRVSVAISIRAIIMEIFEREFLEIFIRRTII